MFLQEMKNVRNNIFKKYQKMLPNKKNLKI